MFVHACMCACVCVYIFPHEWICFQTLPSYVKFESMVFGTLELAVNSRSARIVKSCKEHRECCCVSVNTLCALYKKEGLTPSPYGTPEKFIMPCIK
jgi:hypothetical protein